MGATVGNDKGEMVMEDLRDAGRAPLQMVREPVKRTMMLVVGWWKLEEQADDIARCGLR